MKAIKYRTYIAVHKSMQNNGNKTMKKKVPASAHAGTAVAANGSCHGCTGRWHAKRFSRKGSRISGRAKGLQRCNRNEIGSNPWCVKPLYDGKNVETDEIGGGFRSGFRFFPHKAMFGRFQALEIIQGWLTTLPITTFCNHPRKCVYVRLQHINALLQRMSVWRAMKVEILLCSRFECVWLGCYNKFIQIFQSCQGVGKDTWLFSAWGFSGSQNGILCAMESAMACSRWFPWTSRTSNWCSFRLLKLANLRADMTCVAVCSLLNLPVKSFGRVMFHSVSQSLWSTGINLQVTRAMIPWHSMTDYQTSKARST